jgi:anti-sigma28 factor (negative regulator of flagellin synthesis)
MKIDVNSIQPANAYKITGKNIAAIQMNPISHQDTIEISSDAKLFSDALRTVMASIGERLNHTEADLTDLRNKVANGEYHVDNGKLAKDIMMDK